MGKIRVQVAGRIRSGKDSVFAIVSDKYPEVKRFAYADILKVICKEVMWICHMVLWAAGIKIDKTEFTNILECKDFMRIIYIRFGTGVVRNQIDEHAWYNATNKKNDWELKNEEYIITDPRFPNEYEGNRDIYKMKCFVLKVDREILFQRFMKDFPQSNEEKFQEFYDSETEQLSDFLLKSDENIIVIENNGTFEEFEAKILAEIEKIRNEC